MLDPLAFTEKKINYYYKQENKLTISSHSDLDTLLKSAVLTLCSVLSIYATVARRLASVRQLVSHSSVEKTLTSFTRKNAIVAPGGRRVTDSAIDGLFWVVVPIDLM